MPYVVAIIRLARHERDAALATQAAERRHAVAAERVVGRGLSA